ncbi:MAG: hypothetical protein HQK49_07640 [Oligoflexia bacterium]|nr:hypothetical protein [Oligoflexia bacterium]
MSKKVLWKSIFFIIGLVGLIYIISDYGVATLYADMLRIGFLNLFLLSLTFIPTLVCYACAWMLVTENSAETSRIPIIFFIKSMTISISLNNLTPFLKVGGEPIKAILLSSHIPAALAIRSTILYNIIHVIATILSFILICLLIPLCFDNISSYYTSILLIAAIVSILFVLPFFFFPLKKVKRYAIFLLSRFASNGASNGASKNSYHSSLRKVVLKTIFSISQLIYFSKRNGKKIYLAIFLEVFARFLEGITFYFAFKLLGNHLSIFTAAILDVGRTLIDTIFFFIPYQIGGRESGVMFLMNNILNINSHGYLFAVLSYRLVEIFWMVLGQLVFLEDERARRIKAKKIKAKKVGRHF